MSKATNRHLQEQVNEARRNLEITTIISVGVSEYQHLPPLVGPVRDIARIRDIFVDNPETQLYSDPQLLQIINPTSSELRKIILEFADTRTARGDIIIFYFSGHGSVLGGGDFVLCTKDSRFNPAIDGGGILSTSAVLFQDIVRTFSSIDARPIFIIDACFSGTIALAGNFQVGQMVQNEAYTFGNMYALLCSSSAEVESKDTSEGGAFTIRFHEAVESGIDSAIYRNKPLLTLRDVSVPLVEILSRDGYPLPRLFVGPQLPQIGIAKHTAYQPETESFPPLYRRIVECVWNEGNTKEIHIEELGQELGRGAYSNHSKLSRPPWGLLEDGQTGSHRVITERGIQFIHGELSIPKKIMKDPKTWEWVPDPEAEYVFIHDIGE